jgi:HSP20 family protein
MVEEKDKESKQEVKKTDPARVLNPFEEMDKFFDSHFPSGWMRPFQWPRLSWGESVPFEGKMPNVDVIDRENEVVVKAELPGVDKKDIDVSVSKNTVTIKGKVSHEEKEEKGNYYRCEISRGAYSRTLPLPAEVDEEKAKANIKDGILELTLPKVEKAKSKKINVE